MTCHDAPDLPTAPAVDDTPPTTPVYVGALELAKLLAHKLARITDAPAHVVNDGGHPLLASALDIGVYWRTEQIVFTAPAPEH